MQDDTIVLDGTTMEELEQYHAETLRGVLADVNRQVADAERRQRAQDDAKRRQSEAHATTVDDIARRLQF